MSLLVMWFGAFFPAPFMAQTSCEVVPARPSFGGFGGERCWTTLETGQCEQTQLHSDGSWEGVGSNSDHPRCYIMDLSFPGWFSCSSHPRLWERCREKKPQDWMNGASTRSIRLENTGHFGGDFLLLNDISHSVVCGIAARQHCDLLTIKAKWLTATRHWKLYNWSGFPPDSSVHALPGMRTRPHSFNPLKTASKQAMLLCSRLWVTRVRECLFLSREKGN